MRVPAPVQKDRVPVASTRSATWEGGVSHADATERQAGGIHAAIAMMTITSSATAACTHISTAKMYPW
ncbi:hypothetical protein SAMN04487848_2791 [Microbacterium sp. ru370.1]|nr:hypothetical protein SAMN04487848_2791 [Microbacterium sp. ru370.1]SIT92736.1 hypothetical protein SAMN05880579_2789 [Microbacterium sp. RU1D]